MRQFLAIFAAGILAVVGDAALPTGLRNRAIQRMAPITCQSGCINLGHPLATGLVFMGVASVNWVFGLADISGHGTGIATVGTPTFLSSPYGGAVGGFVHGTSLFDAINAEITATIPSGHAARTYAALARFTSTTFATYAPMLFSGNCGTGGQAFEIGFDNSGAVCSNCAWVADNGFGRTVTWTADLSWHLITATFPGTSTNATDMVMYIDGRIPGAGTVGSNNTVNTTTGGTFNLLLGDSSGGCTGVATNAQIAAAWVWNRSLTQPEIQLLVADPFGLMYNRLLPRNAPASSAPPPPFGIINQ